jgi:glycine/serine hydroxymethyltransferase
LKVYGEQNNIDIFVNGSFGAPISDAHLIGLIASGLFQSSAYYVADYGQGAMLFTIKTDKLVAAKNEQARILTVIPQMISAYDMHHKNAITHYLKAKNYAISQDKNTLTATKNANSLIVEFDDLGRMTNLNGQITN